MAGEALEKNPNHIGARILKASVSVTRKQWNEAQTELESTLALDPKHIETYLSLARYYEQRGKAQENPAEAERFNREAERVFRQAVETDGHSSTARLAFGDFLFANKREAEAEQQLRAAFDAAPRKAFDLRFHESAKMWPSRIGPHVGYMQDAHAIKRPTTSGATSQKPEAATRD